MPVIGGAGRMIACLGVAIAVMLTACAGDGHSGLDARGGALGLIREDRLATGFVVDRAGHVLTAGHAVEGCVRLYVYKGSRLLAADVVALATSPDLALLQVAEPLAPPAVFAAAQEPTRTGGVFVAGYGVLPRLLAEGGGLFNAVVMAADERQSEIALVSDATHGASGAMVLDANALVIGVVTRRTAHNRVLAAAADTVRSFLDAQGIAIATDSRPQLGAFQDRARRAATLTVGIRCFGR